MNPAPIETQIVNEKGIVTSRAWVLWLQKLVARSNEGVGVSGTFTTADAKTVTVVDGIITSIV